MLAESHGEKLVSQLDVVQYLLERAGVEGGDLDGVSLAPTVLQGLPHSREFVYAEEGATGLRPEPDLIAMVRTCTHKLIFFQGTRTGQLFDLVEDPGETRNRWDDAAYQAVRAELTTQLLDWLYGNKYRHRELFVDSR